MPRDVNGNVTPPPGTIVNSGDAILPSQHNPVVTDYAAMLEQSLSRDGQGGMRAPLNMNGFKITNVGTATLPGDAVSLGNIGPAVGSAAEKSPLVNNDRFMVADSQASNGLKSIRWSSLKTLIENIISLATNDPWAFQPIGVPIPVMMDGVFPSNSGSAYKYVMLTMGRSNYHGNMLTNESSSGSGPLLTATARINLPASPLHNRTVRLLNNEARFLRAGYESQIGNVENDALQNVTGAFTSRNTSGGGVVIYQGSGAFRVGNLSETLVTVDASGSASSVREATFDASRVARTSNETRPKNIRVCYIMRIL